MSDVDMSDSTPVDSVAMITMANCLKEEGNAALKAGDHTTAVEKYKAGLEKLVNVPTDAEGRNDVKKSLCLNLALSSMKLEQWFDCIEAAGNALALEPTNVKALFRRGVARVKYGMADQGKADLMEVLKLEPANADARRELLALKTSEAESAKENKKKFSGMFAKSLYDDRAKETERKLKAEEEQRAIRKGTWQKEMARRREAGEAMEDFETWDANRKAKEEKERERIQKEHASDFTPYGQKDREEAPALTPEEEEKRKQESEARLKAQEEARRRRAEEKAARAKEEEVLDEEEQKILEETKKMGYCYFRRDLTEEEKAAREEQLKPIKFEATAHDNDQYKKDIVESAQQAAAHAEQGKAISSWNSGGTTFEEKDVSGPAREALQAALSSVQIAVTPDVAEQVFPIGKKQRPCLLADVSSAAEMAEELGMMSMLEVTKGSVNGEDGEATIALVRGSKRFLYDFSDVKLNFKGILDGSTPVEGSLILEEITSTRSNDEVDWTKGAKIRWTTKNGATDKQLNCLGAALRFAVSERLDKFVEEFKALH